MMLTPEIFFKRYGVRTPGQILQPRLIPIDKLTLPRNSLLHYLPESEVELGPSPSNALLKNVTRLVFVGHETQLKSTKGNPRRLSVPLTPKITQYRNLYRRLRMLTKIEVADKEPQNLIVINYCLLPYTVRYVRSYFAQYYAWYNLYDTQIKTVVDYLGRTRRNQYMVLDLPRVRPSLNALRRAETAITRETLKAFSDSSGLALLDLFTWCGPNRTKSLLSQIPHADLSRVNLIVKRVSAWFVINLGKLDEYRKGSLDELGDLSGYSEEQRKSLERTLSQGVPTREMPIRLLKMVSALYKADSLMQDDVIEDDGEVVTDENEALLQDIDAQVDDPEQISQELEIISQPVTQEELDTLDVEMQLESSIADEESVDEAIDEDGNLVREALSVDTRDDLPSAVGSMGQSGVAPEDAILKKADELAQINGLLSAAEYRRIQQLAVAYKKIPDPYTGKGSLAEAQHVDPKTLMLDTEVSYPDMPEVFDKSMLKSTVDQMDKRYVTQVMRADILRSVMQIQRANVAVTGYDIERVVDAVSDYEIHTVQLAPVVGKPSTIRFRIPTINPNGTFVSNGVTFHLKKQRIGLPIVKISPIRVGLTTDYGTKLFVETSQRATFNYDRWLVATLRARGLSADGVISELRTSSVANQSLDLPKLYTLFAESFVSFKVDGFFYYFDHARRFTQGGFDEERVKRVEKDGMVAIARKGQELIAIDRDNTFYRVDAEDALYVLGRAEEVFELPMEKAPVPMAELKLFSKVIPVGVVLSYLLGLDELIRLSGASTRRVPTGERLNLSSDEFAVRFLNESIIFRRDEALPALLFSGFNLYHAAVKLYTSGAFNKKDIYLPLLDAYGLGVRYIREMDNLMALFIDPISADILRWMGEPTEFAPLLLRAAQMLTTRYVPDKLDANVDFVDNLDRVRGYDRIAGSIYREIVKSVRQYNGRTASASASISMNPHSVWIDIVQDRAAAPIEQTNPIRNAKEREVMTFGGNGGRSRQSMVAQTRVYKDSDVGFVSEAGVDSGDVGIISYVPPNANFTTVYGTVKKDPDVLSKPASLLSTSALLAPCADMDDPKRVSVRPLGQ